MGLPRVVALLVTLAVAAGTCAEDEPPDAAPDAGVEEDASPAPAGVRVGLVLPPGDLADDLQLAALRADLETLVSAPPDGVASIRLVVPDDEDFAVDMAALMSQRDHDAVCVLGQGATRIVLDLFELHPERRFCAVPGVDEGPDGVELVEVRYEELGHAIGTAAAHRADGGPIGLLLGADRPGREDFRDGVRAAAGEDRLVERTPGDRDEVEEAVAEVLAAGVEVVIADVGAGGAELMEALAAEDVALLAPEALVTDSELREATVLSWRLQMASALRPVLARMVDDDAAVPGTVGFAADLFDVTFGPLAGPGLRAEVERVVEELAAGDRDPFEAVPPQDVEGVDEDDAEVDEEDADEDGEATDG